MKVISEKGLADFPAWEGGRHTKDIILDRGKEQEFNHLIELLYPEGIGEYELNDLLWFDDSWIFEKLGIDDPYGRNKEENMDDFPEEI